MSTVQTVKSMSTVQTDTPSGAARTNSSQQPSLLDSALKDVIPLEHIGDKLSHPPWVRLIERIPKAARPSCATLLNQLLRKIIANHSDLVAWRQFLSFGATILAKPERGGSNRNLSNVLIKRLAGWDGAVFIPPPNLRDQQSSLPATTNLQLQLPANLKQAISLLQYAFFDRKTNLLQTARRHLMPSRVDILSRICGAIYGSNHSRCRLRTWKRRCTPSHWDLLVDQMA